MAQFETPGQREFDAASPRGARRMRESLLAVSARYDRRGERLIITLNNARSLDSRALQRRPLLQRLNEAVVQAANDHLAHREPPDMLS